MWLENQPPTQWTRWFGSFDDLLWRDVGKWMTIVGCCTSTFLQNLDVKQLQSISFEQLQLALSFYLKSCIFRVNK